MIRKGQTSQESSPKVPAYIVTFSDMTTLLLTFFVMLLSLSSVQDPELFNIGRGSFVESVREMGLGVLFGGRPAPDFGHVKVKYFISTPDKWFEDRTIDAKDVNIRRIFQKVDRSMKSMPSQIVAEKTNFSITNIRFAPGDATLNESSKRFLTEFSAGLQQDIDIGAIRLYVLGLAADETTEKKQWIVSAKRAQAAADFLKDILPTAEQRAIYSWGAGPGGDWVQQNSPISRESQILIAVMRTND